MYLDHILLYSPSNVSPFQIHVLFFKKKFSPLTHWVHFNTAQMYIDKESSSGVWATYHCSQPKEKWLSLARQSWIDNSTSTRGKTSVAPPTPLLEVLHDLILSRSYTGSHSCCEFIFTKPCHIQKAFHSPRPLHSSSYILSASGSEMFWDIRCKGKLQVNIHVQPILSTHNHLFSGF